MQAARRFAARRDPDQSDLQQVTLSPVRCSPSQQRYFPQTQAEAVPEKQKRYVSELMRPSARQRSCCECSAHCPKSLTSSSRAWFAAYALAQACLHLKLPPASSKSQLSRPQPLKNAAWHSCCQRCFCARKQTRLPQTAGEQLV